MKFSDLKFKPHELSCFGVRASTKFPNGYGASIIMGPLTYGGTDFKYEAAVLRDGRPYYESGITNNVLGYLDEEDVEKFLAQVEALPPISTEE